MNVIHTAGLRRAATDFIYHISLNSYPINNFYRPIGRRYRPKYFKTFEFEEINSMLRNLNIFKIVLTFDNDRALLADIINCPYFFERFTYTIDWMYQESLSKIERRVEEVRLEAEAAAAAAAEAAKEKSAGSGGHSATDANTTMTTTTSSDDDDSRPRPNPSLEAGKKLPSRFGDFPPELFGKPIEDIDEFYEDKFVSINVVNRNLFLSRTF